MQYGTTEAATACNVTLNTIRAWAKDYGQFLSPGASGSSVQRVFTAWDLDVLKYVAQLRSERMQKDAILIRLGETSFPEVDTKAEIEPVQDDQSTGHVTAVTASPQAPLATLDGYGIETIFTRLEHLERSREPAFLYGFAAGAIGMGILFLLIVGVAALYGGFR